MTADPIGGVWTYVLELARALEWHGIDIALATMGADLTRDQYAQVLARKNVRLFESAYRLEWMDDAWNDVDRAGDWLLRIADRIRPDLVHLNGYSHATLPWNSPVLVVAHSCVLSWWRAVKNEDAPPKYGEYCARVAAGCAAADSIVAPSSAMRAAVQLHYDAPATCAVIHNARDPRLFAPERKEPVVFACGRIWDEAKNLRLLDEIGQMSRWPITVAGDCRHPDGSTVALRNVRCLGNISPGEVAQELSRASIFILPAFYEPFGLSVLEAGMSGCALVLGDIASLREIWDGAAIFLSPSDALGFTNALNSLAENSRLREDFGRRARARALEFSPHRMADEYVGAYHHCFHHEFQSATGKPPLVVEEVAA
jgi:glycogen synthase